MRRWFAREIDRIAPNVIMMNYAVFDGLVQHRRWRGTRRIIDSHDLVTLNRKMWERLKVALPPFPIDPGQVADSVVALDFFRAPDIRVDPAEFRTYDRYDFTLAIAPAERDAIRQSVRNTSVVFVPITGAATRLKGSYEGPAIFASGQNPFNVQGLLFFAKRVLPDVLAACPDFSLSLTGHCSNALTPTRGLTPLGQVQDIEIAYESAAFAICPVFGLTGQQVKIVEAMACGLTVVAIQHAAANSPIKDGVNGLVARDADEFVRHVVALWRDRALCKRLGEEARATIGRECSESLLKESLALTMR
jgi:hypothetical protein